MSSGAIAQLGEHLLCKQEVGGSIPPGSTPLVEFWNPGDTRVPLFNKMDKVVKALNRTSVLFYVLGMLHL